MNGAVKMVQTRIITLLLCFLFLGMTFIVPRRNSTAKSVHEYATYSAGNRDQTNAQRLCAPKWQKWIGRSVAGNQQNTDSNHRDQNRL